MAETSYPFTVSGSITAQALDMDRLSLEIRQSAIVTALDRIDRIGDSFSVVFKDALSAEDATLLTGLVTAHSGVPLLGSEVLKVQQYASQTQPVSVTSDGRVKVASGKPDATKVTFISHDWTDPTTWKDRAVRVVDEVATNSGDNLTYTLSHPNVIDTYHGKLFNEDFLTDTQGNSYRVVVKVNDVAKTEQDPHLGSGGDYTINYAAGSVTFLSALASTDVVKVTYHYATTSEFVIAPTAGRRISISFVEVQFSTDVELRDSVDFQLYGLVDVFAPQLMPGVPSGTKIPLGNPVRYKTITDFQSEAVRSFPVYPAMGGAGWRGSALPVVIFDWDYLGLTDLRSDYGMEIRVKLQRDIPFGGWYATATFYATSEAL